jgi:cystathionine beta-lyase
VKNARIVLADRDGVRAGMVASWLRQLGHEAYVLEGGIAALAEMDLPAPQTAEIPELKTVRPDEVAGLIRGGNAHFIDVRPAMSYRQSHISGAHWSIRPVIGSAVTGHDLPVVLVADDPDVAALAAHDLREAGIDVAGVLDGGPDDWQAAGLAMVATPDDPAEDACIDFLFFTHGRHQGNAEACRQYLAWEVGLVDQLDEQERGVFAIVPAPR